MTAAVEQRRFRTPDGLHLAADVGGDPGASSVILLHGGGQTRHSWSGAMRGLLAAGYHVVNVDARGHGDSDWAADGDYHIETLAVDLRGIIDTLRAPPALVGASMGGATALLALGGEPAARASALVLVDIVPRIEIDGARRIMQFMSAHRDGFATVDDAAAAVAEYYPQRPRPKDPSGLLRNLRRRANGRLFWHWDPRMLELNQRAEPPLRMAALEQAATRVTIPSLLVRGLQSDIVSDAGVAELQRVMPHVEVLNVRDAGHMVAGDRNDAFNRGVIDFLRRHVP